MSKSYILLTGIPEKETRKRNRSLTNSRNVQELKMILFKMQVSWVLSRRDIDIDNTDMGI